MHLKYGRIFNDQFMTQSLRLLGKNFENQSIFGKVMGDSNVLFFKSQCRTTNA